MTHLGLGSDSCLGCHAAERQQRAALRHKGRQKGPTLAAHAGRWRRGLNLGFLRQVCSESLQTLHSPATAERGQNEPSNVVGDAWKEAPALMFVNQSICRSKLKGGLVG